VRHLRSDLPIFGLQAIGIGDEAPLPESVESLISDYVTLIRSIKPHGPYSLLGWSFGGNLAHAVACRLQQQGDLIPLLAVLDSYPSENIEDHVEIVFDSQSALEDMATLLGIDMEALGTETVDIASLIKAGQNAGHVLSFMRPSEVERMLVLAKHNSTLMPKLRQEKFYGNMAHFRATEDADDAASAELWGPYVSGEIFTHEVTCRHSEMTEPSAIAVIGDLLNTYINGQLSAGVPDDHRPIILGSHFEL
jgi:thioesterase domain-containing protein